MFGAVLGSITIAMFAVNGLWAEVVGGLMVFIMYSVGIVCKKVVEEDF